MIILKTHFMRSGNCFSGVLGENLIEAGGGYNMFVHADFFRAESEGQGNQLRKVQDGDRVMLFLQNRDFRLVGVQTEMT